MKKKMTVFIALAVLTLDGAAWALDTNTLTVRASVTRACKFSSATSTLYWCTKDVTTGPVTATNGGNWSGTSGRIAGPGGDLIPYTPSLTPDATPNAGPGSPRTLTIDGSVLGADSTGVTAGSYQDSVTLAINP